MKVLIALLFVLNLCFANIGQITALVGNASIERSGEVVLAVLGTKIENKDIIKTQENSKLQIIFTDNTIVTVGKNSALDINDYLYDEQNPKASKTNLNFFKGSFKTITGQIGKINRKRFKLKTKTASIGIRGTFVVGDQDMVACIDGGITVENQGVFVDVDANEFTNTQEGKPPTPSQTLTQQNLQNLQKNIDPKKEKKEGKEKQDSKEDEPSQDTNIQPSKSQNDELSNDLPNQGEIEEFAISIDENVQEVNEEDNSDKVDEVVNDATNNIFSFEGKVNGDVILYGDNENPKSILEDDTNQVLLNFDIGGGRRNMTGSMKFQVNPSENVPSNTFDYDLESSIAKLNGSIFEVNAKNKTSGTQTTIKLTGNQESVKTDGTQTLKEGADNAFTANITFEATKK